MGAIDDHGQVIEPQRAGGAHVVQVALDGILGVDDAANAGADRAQTGAGRDQVFDLVFGGVVEFVAARAEDLDAVVRHRVVRRRDHDAEVGVVGAGQIGHRRGGQHAHPQRVDALAGQAGDHRGLQHLAAGPRVPTDHGDTLARFTHVGQPPRRGGAQSQRQFGGQLPIGDSADTVGAE